MEDTNKNKLLDEVTGRYYPASYNVNPFKLDRELAAWCEQYRKNKLDEVERPQMSNYLGTSFLQIASGISGRYNFIGYTFKDEMISDAIEHLMKYVHNYKSDSATQSGYPPAYSYVYRMCWNCFTNRIKEEEKEQVLKYKSIEVMGGIEAFGDYESLEYGEEEKSGSNALISDYMNKIYEFESKYLAKPEKKVKEIQDTPSDDVLTFFMEA